MQTSNYSAEFGQVGGGPVSITARSGSNEYHASGLQLPKNAARIWYAVARTRRALEKARMANRPKWITFACGWWVFNGQAITDKLKKLGAEIAPSNDEKLLRFPDPNGFTVELKSGA